MTAYGIRIESDFSLWADLPDQAEFFRTVTLRKESPLFPKNSFSQKVLSYARLHGRKIVFSRMYAAEKAYMPGEPLVYEVENVVRFSWWHGSDEIWIQTLRDCTDERLAFWVLHPFLPFFLTVENSLVLLHGSSIQIGREALLLLAPFDGGKSTLVNKALSREVWLVSDDVVPIAVEGKEAVCIPSHPYIHLDRKAESLGTRSRNYADRFLPLKAICLLSWNRKNDNIFFEEIRGVRRFVILKEHGVYTSLLTHQDSLDLAIGTLGNQLPFFNLTRPFGMKYLDQTVEDILSYFGSRFEAENSINHNLP